MRWRVLDIFVFGRSQQHPLPLRLSPPLVRETSLSGPRVRGNSGRRRRKSRRGQGYRRARHLRQGVFGGFKSRGSGSIVSIPGSEDRAFGSAGVHRDFDGCDPVGVIFRTVLEREKFFNLVGVGGRFTLEMVLRAGVLCPGTLLSISWALGGWAVASDAAKLVWQFELVHAELAVCLRYCRSVDGRTISCKARQRLAAVKPGEGRARVSSERRGDSYNCTIPDRSGLCLRPGAVAVWTLGGCSRLVIQRMRDEIETPCGVGNLQRCCCTERRFQKQITGTARPDRPPKRV